MSESKTRLGDRGNNNTKRNLPSWMSSRDNGGSSNEKKQNNENNEGEEEQGKGNSKEDMKNDTSKETKHSRKFNASSSNSTDFSKLMEGVVFVLSGFVNPERSTLRSQALAMGAEYQPDWNSDSTLLVCAFMNTPKFRQVEADCGTIVSKEWISECYTLKKLVDIEQYMMHAGKPWRKNNLSCGKSQDIADKKASPPRKTKKEVEKGSIPTPTSSKFSKSQASNPVKEKFSASELKNWATDDLSRTISWLESQDEKPEPSEIKQIAVEGILTCLQDAIDSLEQKQDVRPITEQWNFVPRVVEELAKMEGDGSNASSKSKEDLCRIAKSCKRKYEEELSKIGDASLSKSKKPKGNDKRNSGGKIGNSEMETRYDSDETIEMTEEEIDLACNTVGSKFCK